VSRSRPILWIVGTPLTEEHPVSPAAAETLARVSIVVGESRGATLRYLRSPARGETRAIFFLDPPREAELHAALAALDSMAPDGEAALLADVGMPLLFDPGGPILGHCRRRGFEIRSVPGATSWGTACALSGFPPPLVVAGFPPREPAARQAFLRDLAADGRASVLMDTPYRFGLLLDEARRAFGPRREAFLGWELGKPSERLLWGTLGAIAEETRAQGLSRGEFVLVMAIRERNAPSRNARSSTRSGR